MTATVKLEGSADGEQWFTMPVASLFVRPFIRHNVVRIIWEGKDVTPPVDHANWLACEMANTENKLFAERFGIEAPRYVYNPDTGEADILDAE